MEMLSLLQEMVRELLYVILLQSKSGECKKEVCKTIIEYVNQSKSDDS